MAKGMGQKEQLKDKHKLLRDTSMKHEGKADKYMIPIQPIGRVTSQL